MVQAPTRFLSICCADAGPGMANANSDIAAATRAKIRVMLSSLRPLDRHCYAVRSGLGSGGSPLSTGIPALVSDHSTFLDRLPQDHHKAAVTRAFWAR